MKSRVSVISAITLLVRTGTMSASQHGNFSLRVDKDRMLLTPKGMSSLPEPEELALVDFDGIVEEGDVAPSIAEVVGMHAAVYRSRPDMTAVVHTHSPAATAFALAHRALPCRYEGLLRSGQTRSVPVVPWALRGSAGALEGISQTLAEDPDTRALLLANHGLLAFGPTPDAAALLVVALEEAARAELAAVALGGAKDFADHG